MLQRTDEWVAARLGCVTASRVSDVMATTKSGYSASRQNYMAQLICERLTGRPAESYTSEAMQRGIEKEATAREMYVLSKFDAEVTEVGSVQHPAIAYFSASPDGLVNDDGLVEIKCPNTWTHLQFLKTQAPKREYVLQMQVQMMCTGRKWCDFVSYDDRLPDELNFVSVRVEYDAKLAKQIETEVIKFLDELDAEIKAIQGK